VPRASFATAQLAQMIKDLRAEVDREHETVEHLRARDRVRTDLVSTVSAELISMIEHLSAVESGAAFAR
jgi:hypothetical protein